MNDFVPPDDPLERALDSALSRALQPPPHPPQLRARLRAAMAQAAAPDLTEARHRLEREHREQLQALTQQYVRLRRRTLGTMVGAAFAAGAAAAVAMPWLTAHAGPSAPDWVAGAGALAGIAIALSYGLPWRRDPSVHR